MIAFESVNKIVGRHTLAFFLLAFSCQQINSDFQGPIRGMFLPDSLYLNHFSISSPHGRDSPIATFLRFSASHIAHLSICHDHPIAVVSLLLQPCLLVAIM